MKIDVLNKIKGGLIVSCQALEGEALHGSSIMSKMAIAARDGGAVGIRANSVKDIKAIKKVVDLPVIGIIKKTYPNSERFITPTLKEIKQLLDTDVEIIAMDATLRKQIDSISLKEKVDYIHAANKLVMADISTLEEGIEADKIGFDLISTTLSGYTKYSNQNQGPDIKLLSELIKKTNTPIIAEGKIFLEKDLKNVLQEKPFAIVIGSAITRPKLITKHYNSIIENFK